MPPVLFAALAMTLATALFAAVSVMAKALGAGALGPAVAPVTVSIGRFVFGFLTVVAVAALLPRGPADRAAPSPHWGWHTARTALGFTGSALMFAAVAQMPLADANALSFLSPVVTMLLAIPFLGERVGPWRWVAAGIALMGALVLLRPGAGAIQPAALLALGAALAMGVEGIFIKKLAGREPPRQILLVNNGIGAAIALVLAAVLLDWPQAPAVWAGLVAVGAIMVSGQFLFLLASARGEASYVAPFFYLVLVWAAVLDLLVFGVLPDATSLLGAATVLAGGVLLAWREALARKRGPVLGTRA